jgi:hypothetical protein
MTSITALIVNVVLMAGIAVALAVVMRIPFRLRQARALAHATYVAGPEHDELSRAA